MRALSILLTSPRLRRGLDLCGAAALAAAGIHVVLACARGWPRVPFIDGPMADLTLGVFFILAAVYGVRWFARPAGAPSPRSVLFGNAPPRWLGPLVRISGRASGVAGLVALAFGALQHEHVGEITLRSYYVAFLLYCVEWRFAPQHWT